MTNLEVGMAQSVHAATGHRLDGGFHSLQKQEFSTSAVSMPAPGPTNPPIQWVLGEMSLGVKRPGR
jgi:hypothetical protein